MIKEGVHLLQELRDAGFGITHAALALELERLGDDTDGENAELARGPGDNGCCARAGAAAHAGGNEHHVRAGQMIADLVDGLFRCGAPDIGLRAGAKAAGHLRAHLDDALGLRTGERLRIGIGDDEVDAFEPRLDHVVDGIAAGAADPEHENTRPQLVNVGDASHCCPTVAPPSRGMREKELLATPSLAVCVYQSRGELPQPAFRLVDRIIRAGTGPQHCDLPLEPGSRLPGGRGLGSRLLELGHQAIGALAFMLEIGAVTGRACFKLRDLTCNAATIVVH